MKALLIAICLVPRLAGAAFASDAAQIEALLQNPEVAAKFDVAHPGLDRLTKEAEHDGLAPIRLMSGRCTILVELRAASGGEYEVADIGKWVCGI